MLPWARVQGRIRKFNPVQASRDVEQVAGEDVNESKSLVR